MANPNYSMLSDPDLRYSDELDSALGPPVIVHATQQDPTVDQDDRVYANDDLLWHELTQACVDSSMDSGEEIWSEVCDFFRHDPSNHSSGRPIPGFNVRLRPYQLVDVFMMLNACKSSTFTGTFNCAKPGLGKTLETLTACGIIALACACKEHFLTNREAHEGSRQGVCRLDHPFGIKCYCIPNSLTRHICAIAQRNPQMIVAPPAIASQWAAELVNRSERTVILRNGLTLFDEPLLLPAMLTREGVLKCPTGSTQSTRPTIHDFMADLDVAGVLERGLRLKEAFKREGPISKNRGVKASNNELTFTLKGINRADLGLVVETKRPLAISAKSRYLLFCSSSMLSGGQFDSVFSRHILVDQFQTENRLKRGKTRVHILRCFTPSFVAYDEWTEAKGASTNIIQVLCDLCDIANDSRKMRPLTTLLSGTPMPRGPKDIEGVLPLVRMTTEEDPVAQLKEAYKVAIANSLDFANVELCTEAKRVWVEAMETQLGGCMFHRWYGMSFLDSVIPDPRPVLLKYQPTFSFISHQHQAELSKLEESLRNLIRDKYPQRHPHQLKQLEKSHLFRMTLQCSVIPSLAGVSCFLEKSSIGNKSARATQEREAWLACNAAQLRCHALDLVVHIVRSGGPSKKNRDWHGLILTLFPDAAAACAAWLKHASGDSVMVEHITSGTVKPRERAKYAKDLGVKAAEHLEMRLVIVSTYQLLATAVDGLQTFASFLIKLGEPFTPSCHEQAEGRIHRGGQKHQPVVYEIHGPQKSLDWEFHMKNKRNQMLMCKGGMLSSFITGSSEENYSGDERSSMTGGNGGGWTSQDPIVINDERSGMMSGNGGGLTGQDPIVIE